MEFCGQATNAKEETIIGQEKEQVEIAYVSAAINKLGDDVTDEDLQNELDKSVGLTKTLVTPNSDGTLNVLFNDTEHNYNVNKGNVSKVNFVKWSLNEDGSITNGEVTIQIGDYVDYSQTPISGTVEPYIAEVAKTGADNSQTYNVTDYSGGWKVLGVDSSGKLKIISEDVVGSISLGGQSGYQYREEVLNNICSLHGYGKYADSARSVRVEDINELSGYQPEIAQYSKGTMKEYGLDITYSWNGTNTYPVYSSTNGSGNTYYGHENVFYWYDNGWQHSDNPSTETEIVTLKNNAYVYFLSDTEETGLKDGKYYCKVSSNIKNTILLSKPYYLPNRSIYQDTSYNWVSFDNGAVGSNGWVGNSNESYRSTSIGPSRTILGTSNVRAVVLLQSNITLKKAGENSWSITE